MLLKAIKAKEQAAGGGKPEPEPEAKMERRGSVGKKLQLNDY